MIVALIHMNKTSVAEELLVFYYQHTVISHIQESEHKCQILPSKVSTQKTERIHWNWRCLTPANDSHLRWSLDASRNKILTSSKRSSGHPFCTKSSNHVRSQWVYGEKYHSHAEVSWESPRENKE